MTNPRFLVVEDDTDTRQLLCTMLHSLECETLEAESGERALQIIDELKDHHNLDAVFLDIMMPGLNGYDVLKGLKARDYSNSIPVVMLTAKDSSKDIIDGYSEGADYYITKPFTVEQLVYGLDMLFSNGADETTEEGNATKEQRVFQIDECIPEEN